MESNYGIGVANRYALFLEDEGADPMDMPSMKIKAEKKAAAALATKPSTTTGKENKSKAKPAVKTSPAATTVVNKPPAGKTLPSKDGQQQSKGPRAAARDGNNNGKTTSGNLKASVSASAATSNNTVSQEGQQPKKTRREGFPRIPGKSTGSEVQSREANKKIDRPLIGDGNRAARGQQQPRTPRENNLQQRPPRDTDGETGDRRPPRRFREDRGPLTSQNNPNFSAAGAPGESNSTEEGRNRPFREKRAFGGGSRGAFGGSSRGGRGGGREGSFENRRNYDNRDGRGKPVYDRHSGSDKAGVKAIEKRDGAGAHNWGNLNDDLAGQSDNVVAEGTAVSSGEENTTEGTTDAAAADDATPAVNDTPAEEESKEMTLEEWKQLQIKEKKRKPQFNTRKPGEGQDTSQWKKTYLLENKKNQDEQVVAEEDEEYEEVEVTVVNREKKKKVIDIDINFKDTFRENRRGGGFGGDRGGFRGNRGDREPRGDRRDFRPSRGSFNRKAQSAPKVEDINDFPSLGVAA